MDGDFFIMAEGYRYIRLLNKTTGKLRKRKYRKKGPRKIAEDLKSFSVHDSVEIEIKKLIKEVNESRMDLEGMRIDKGSFSAGIRLRWKMQDIRMRAKKIRDLIVAKRKYQKNLDNMRLDK